MGRTAHCYYTRAVHQYSFHAHDQSSGRGICTLDIYLWLHTSYQKLCNKTLKTHGCRCEATTLITRHKTSSDGSEMERPRSLISRRMSKQHILIRVRLIARDSPLQNNTIAVAKVQQNLFYCESALIRPTQALRVSKSQHFALRLFTRILSFLPLNFTSLVSYNVEKDMIVPNCC